MQKPKIYAPVPEFNQESQYVVQLEPVDMEDCIFIGVEVRDLELDEDDELTEG